MKRSVIFAVIIILVAAVGFSYADEAKPIPITAEEAFDAVQTQTDPLSGEPKSVVLVDVRTRAEYYWVGTACKVKAIVTTRGKTIIPDLGKVILLQKGKLLNFDVNGRNRMLSVKQVAEMDLSPIAINIPYKLWDEESGTTVANSSFTDDINSLAEYSGHEVLILFCRSGGRSEDCLADFDVYQFDAVYEIDQPDGKDGRGGFEGTTYSDVYNGYRGFPERLTDIQDHPSVSWKDAGLPMKTGVSPFLPQPE